MDENQRNNCFLERSQMSDTFDETTDETTLSLPSISLMAEKTTEATETTTARPKTIKESERLANELKTENFNLKLRIYCLEKQNNNNNNNLNQNSLPENNEFSKELLKREKTLKTFSKLLNENKETIREFERKISALTEENSRLATAIVAAKQEENSSAEEKALLLQLMSHLFEFCQLFRGEDSQRVTTEEDERRRNQQLSRLLNSSEDVLNCASILVTNRKPSTSATHSHNSGMNALNFDTDEESEDFWSEPDRQASRARIGLCPEGDETTVLNTSRQRRRRRNQSVGISTQMTSSFGLIDLNSDSKETEIQTDISFFTSNDKCVQTSDDDRRQPVVAVDVEKDVFPEFESKTKQKSQKRGEESPKSPKSGQKSIYTYFASLSPLNKRTKESNKQSSESSSQWSVAKCQSLQTLSPDLGIETETNDSAVRKVFLSLKDLRKLKRYLNDCSSLLKEMALRGVEVRLVLELTTNCLNICGKFSLEENWFRKLEKMRKSKESMEKAIHKQLNKTNELLIKTKENLK